MNTSAVASRARSEALPSSVAEIEHHAALAAVHVDEHAGQARGGAHRDVTRVVAFGRFDLDHVGAHVGHDLRAVGAHDHGGEVDHPDTGERTSMFGGV